MPSSLSSMNESDLLHERFRSLCRDAETAADGRELARYVELLPFPNLREMFMRDALARRAIATGERTDTRTVPHTDIRRFRVEGGIPDDLLIHVPGWRPPPADFSVGADFQRYGGDVTRDPSTCPFARGEGSRGLVLAGGSCLSELYLGETDVESHTLTMRGTRVDPSSTVETRTYLLKKMTDLDMFVVVPEAADGGRGRGRGGGTRREVGRSVLREALECVRPERFLASSDDACCVCGLPIEPGEYVATFCTGFAYWSTRRVRHVGCAPPDESDEEEGEGDGKGEDRLMHTNASDHVTANHSTVNVKQGSLTGDRDRTLLQVTLRVYDRPEDILTGFDLPVSQVMTRDGGRTMEVSELAAFCLANGVLLVTPFAFNFVVESRIRKYAQRYGFRLWIPGLDQRAWDAAAKPACVRGAGLLKLLLSGTRSEDACAMRISEASRQLHRTCELIGADVPDHADVTLSRPFVKRPLFGVLESITEESYFCFERRSKMLPEAALDSDQECPVCYDPLVVGERTAVTSSCGHSLCWTCYERLNDSA